MNDHTKSQLRQMGLSNRASRAPTKENINQKIQYIIDQNFDRRRFVKMAQVVDEEWIS